MDHHPGKFVNGYYHSRSGEKIKLSLDKVTQINHNPGFCIDLSYHIFHTNTEEARLDAKALMDAVIDAHADDMSESSELIESIEPVKSSVSEPVKSSVSEPVESSVSEPVESSISEPVKSSVSEPVKPSVWKMSEMDWYNMHMI